jgi:hypothetical protein
LEINHFIQKLSNIKDATSLKGVKYRDININGSKIYFIRENKSTPESILIQELYNLHTCGMPFNTVVAKKHISGRVQSPSIAILNKLNQLLKFKFPEINSSQQLSKITNEANKIDFVGKLKDETRFFEVFSHLFGTNYLLSKSIEKPISSSEVFLSNNFRDYEFSHPIVSFYEKILNDLNSNGVFSSESLSHYIDALAVNHPFLGTRIIEFDEEQHFTPARMDTLKSLSKILETPYIAPYIEICSDIKYLQLEVFNKHRLKSKIFQIPKTFLEFNTWLINSNEKSSGYICKKNGFEFLGGRIAQRAYYDSLRDTAHLSPKNPNMKVPLRFSKKEFEDLAKTQFSKIPFITIKNILIRILSEKYSINLSNS